MSHPVLLYDGTCGLCAGSIQFVLRHERAGTLQFAPLQGAFARRLIERHPELNGIDSVVWVHAASTSTDEHVAVRSDAAIQVFGYLGGPWRWLRMLRVVPRPIRDAVYDFVARHRHRFTRQQCLLPRAGERWRFIVD